MFSSSSHLFYEEIAIATLEIAEPFGTERLCKQSLRNVICFCARIQVKLTHVKKHKHW
jgi:hypothetical protein